MSACEPLVETCPPIGWNAFEGGWIWFRCVYDGCHPGVGNIIIESNDGEILYNGCPLPSARKLVWLDFPAAKLWGGGIMQVNYGLPGCSESGHGCSRATFEWGSVEDTANPLGVAYLDNAGGANDRGNVCDAAALDVWRVISRGNVPDTVYIESAIPWGADNKIYPVGSANFSDHVLGPYPRDYWIFSGDAQVDDDLVIDGKRFFPNGVAGPVGGENVFLKFLPKGQAARVNVWNTGGYSSASGSLRLYPSAATSEPVENLSRCNAFIIPPQTIGAYTFKNQGAALGSRKVFYRKGGVPDPAPCSADAVIPSNYVPKVSGVLAEASGGLYSATTRFLYSDVGIPSQVPEAKSGIIGASEMWRVDISRNGASLENFYLVLFFPSTGFAGGMVEVGAAIQYKDYYVSEVVRVGKSAILRINYKPAAQSALIDLAITVDIAFIPTLA